MIFSCRLLYAILLGCLYTVSSVRLQIHFILNIFIGVVLLYIHEFLFQVTHWPSKPDIQHTRLLEVCLHVSCAAATLIYNWFILFAYCMKMLYGNVMLSA